MESIFIINANGTVFLEKHWKSVTSKDILKNHFLDKLKYSADIPPIIQTAQNSINIINIKRFDLRLAAITKSDVAPLMVIEFLHRIVENFQEYFNECSEESLKDNYVVVYELLDEMLDYGFPLTTENNFLKELIKPPNALRKLTNSVTGRTNLSETLPNATLSATPWRRSSVHYTNNEIYFDIVEKIDAIIDKTGGITFSEISGTVMCDSKLSGTPNLLLSFNNPRLLEDVSFHRCVRLKRWEAEHNISFVPPDRSFMLMTYSVQNQSIPIPIYINHDVLQKRDNVVRIDLTIGTRTTYGKFLENVTIEMSFLNAITCTFSATQGKVTFNQSTKLLSWHAGKVDFQARSNIQINVQMPPESSLHSLPSININFTIPGSAISGLKVHELDVIGDINYKAFKGVKYETRAGNFHARL